MGCRQKPPGTVFLLNEKAERDQEQAVHPSAFTVLPTWNISMRTGDAANMLRLSEEKQDGEGHQAESGVEEINHLGPDGATVAWLLLPDLLHMRPVMCCSSLGDVL